MTEPRGTPSRDEVLAREREIMDRWAAGYDAASLTSSYVYRLEREAFADWVIDQLRSGGVEPSEASILDAGCGTGALIEMLARRGAGSLTGLDLSPEMLERGRARHLRQAEWIEGDIGEAGLRGRSFEAVTAVFTMHHLSDPADLFHLAASVLSPGGRLLLLEYDRAHSGEAPGADPAGGGDEDGEPPLRRRAGDLIRRAFARKNRRALDALPVLGRDFNPAHRLLSYDEIAGIAAATGGWELERVPRGALRPTLLYELVETSALDRAAARALGALDSVVSPRTGGTFQWVSARRRLL